MKSMKMFVVVCLGLAMTMMVCNIPANAQGEEDFKAKVKAAKPADFPTDAIKFEVVYKAGGGMDVTARTLGKYVEKYIDQRVVVVNRTGGGGLVGDTYLCKQAPNDGYTVGIQSPSFWTHALTTKKYSVDDIEPLAFITYEPSTWIVKADSPLADKSILDVLSMAKKNPRKLKINITPKQTSEFNVLTVERESGAEFIKVPFQGGKPASIAFLGGHIDLVQLYYTEYKGLHEAGDVKILAVCGNERYVYFPEVPTFNELLNVDTVMKVAWRFAAVPKGVPRDRFNYLATAINAALHEPECIADFEKLGLKVGFKYMTPEETAAGMHELVKVEKQLLIEGGLIEK